MKRPFVTLAPSLVACALGGAAGCGNSKATTPGAGGAGGRITAGAYGGATAFAETLYAAGDGFLESYDVATGAVKPGVVTNVMGPVDLQALADGTVMVNLTGLNQILALDGRTMLEKVRIPSSGMGATRPVHSFITPTYGGKTWWTTMNDGTGATDSSARFVDITPGSATYLHPVGEVKLGIGHHKAAFSATTTRTLMSNIGDCNNVISVYDFTDLAQIQALATWSAADLGWDGSTFVKTCDPTYQNGVPPAPHGAATSKLSKHIYNSLTGSGDIVDVDVDATPPAFTIIHTHGSGGGHIRASKDGRYLYAVQTSPREGDTKAPGLTCQVGQVVVIDAITGALAKEVPAYYSGPGCTTSIAGTPHETDGPGDLRVSSDGNTVYVAIDGGFDVADARTDQLAVFDISDPANPVQKPSIMHGMSTSHVSLTESGDARALFVVDNMAGSTTQIDVATWTVARKTSTSSPSIFNPLTIATWGSAEGPSQQIGVIP